MMGQGDRPALTLYFADMTHSSPKPSQSPRTLNRWLQAGFLLISLSGLAYCAAQPSLNTSANSADRLAQADSQVAQQTTAARSPRAAQVGTNLNGIADWSTQWNFVDVFKTSRDWIPQKEGSPWGQGGKVNFTRDGWVASLEPGQYVETVMMIDSTHYPAGQYTLLYEGQGKITFAFNNAKIVSQTPGRMVVDVKPDGAGIFLQIRETKPQNPIRNIRFIMPGFEQTYQTQPFHPLFLERLAQFKSLRFMDWMATNNSNVVNWADRTTLNSARQAGEKGVALEYMIQLANTLKVDPWFTIPAKASDDYVRQFATMVRDRLDPSLKAHVEYSNEIWNTMFGQHRFAAEQGRARNLDENDFTAALRFYSERSVQIFQIFGQVFGQNANTRLVRVLAGQAANPWTAEQILGWKDAYKSADAYAIAPYFDGADLDKNGTSDLNDPQRVDAVINMSVDQVVDSLMTGVTTVVKPMVDANYTVTQKFGLPLYAYEGGPHLTAYQFPDDKVKSITQLFAAANRHPRMREVYRAYLNQWQQSGGTLFNQFVDVAPPSKWGFWGAMEYQNQALPQAPKYQGLIDFINRNASRP
jgi:hypothetical protein